MSSSFKSNAGGSLPKRTSEQQHNKTSSSKPATISKPSSTTTAPKTKTTTSTASKSTSTAPKQAQEPQPQQQQQLQQPQAPPPQATQAQGGGEDAAVYVRSLLEEMQGRFDAMSKQIISKIDSVGSKVDALDAEITELMREAGVGDMGSEEQEDKSEMGQEAAGNELEESTTVGKATTSMLGHEPVSE